MPLVRVADEDDAMLAFYAHVKHCKQGCNYDLADADFDLCEEGETLFDAVYG